MDRSAIYESVIREIGHIPTSHRGMLQVERAVEVRSMRQDAIQQSLSEIRSPMMLRKIDAHWHKHRGDFVEIGITTKSAYVGMTETHRKRNDLRIFTYITTKPTADRMWILLSVDNGVVAMYNESKKVMWSLFRQKDVDLYVASGSAWWVELIGEGGEIVFSLV